MANNRTITSANAVLYIGVAGLFDVPQRIQGFSADDVTNFDSLSQKEKSMGVDGRASFGFAPTLVKQNIVLQADSLSIDMFDIWWATEQQIRESFIATGTLIVSAVGKKFALTRGALDDYKPIPDLKRSLSARSFSITWERVTPAPN